MLKLLCVFCILSITSMCNGTRSQLMEIRARSRNMEIGARSQNMEMKTYSVKPMNSLQLQALFHFRDTQDKYFFQGGSIKINKPLRICVEKSKADRFLDAMQRLNLNPQSEDSVDEQNNFIEKERYVEECSKQLGQACLEDDDCCEGRCKALLPHGRSCQN